ncbi:uncharacterized protein [Amphiura filiformis]|uniref:uncharacterized protein isoform X2 n=1 Tax=Amphiura filiformis TaxID=82378 RepID=UPI003B22253E
MELEVSVMLFIIVTAHLAVVQSYVCVLKRRPDPSRGGALRWSLPFAEICLCQGVVAPLVAKTCRRNDHEFKEGGLWFVDDPQPLTMRHNWGKDILDHLLDRTTYCAYWSAFSAWSPCSQSCGGGTKTRTMTCSDNGACSGSSSESEDCKTQICPYWSAFTAWSSCSQSCGGGTRTRTRTCSDSGACSGSSSESEGCNTQICPTWPMGTYGLLKPTTGCPSQWATGQRYHDTEDYSPATACSSQCHLPSGSYSISHMVQYFCMKTVDIADTDGRSWPAGQYCIFRKGGSCPGGMTGGAVYWDDENNNNVNSYSGELPDGVYNIDTRIEFCCQTSSWNASHK